MIRCYAQAELENASHELSHLEHELSRDQIKQRALALQEKLSQLTARRYELEEEAGVVHYSHHLVHWSIR